MAMKVSCSCGKQLAISETLAGKRVKCPACDSVFVAPAPSQVQARPQPPAPTAPPPARPRKKRKLPPDGEFSFDCPSIRAERLLAMTGGEEPAELYHLCKLTLTRPPSQVTWYVDLIVCDVGLLVVPYSHHNPAQQQATYGQFGLIGAAIGAVASTMALKKAGKVYDDNQAETDDWDPFELYTGVTKNDKAGGRCSAGAKLIPQEQMGAEFIPADEIESWKWPKGKAKTVEIKWRGRVHKFVRPDDADKATKKGWDRLAEEYEDWQDEASEVLAQRGGGPDDPGLAALLEWGYRPVEKAPAWVGTAVDALADADLAKDLKRFNAPWEAVGRLAGKLEDLDGDAADLSQQLQDIVSRKAKPLMTTALVTAVSGAVMAILSIVFTAGEFEDAIIAISWILTGVLLLTALITWLIGREISANFKKGFKAATK